jgi:hypothetical protein
MGQVSLPAQDAWEFGGWQIPAHRANGSVSTHAVYKTNRLDTLIAYRPLISIYVFSLHN